MRTLITELEGVLVNPGPGYAYTTIQVLSNHGLPVPSCLWSEWPAQLPVEETLGRFFPVGNDVDALHELLVEWADFYLRRGQFENQAYRGVKQALAELRADGWQVFVVSQRARETCDRLLRRFDLRTLIDRLHAPPENRCCHVRRQAVALLREHRAIEGVRSVWLSDDPADLKAADDCGLTPAFAAYGRYRWQCLRHRVGGVVHSPCRIPADVARLTDRPRMPRTDIRKPTPGAGWRIASTSVH